jgi:hypothetical protein
MEAFFKIRPSPIPGSGTASDWVFRFVSTANIFLLPFDEASVGVENCVLLKIFVQSIYSELLG